MLEEEREKLPTYRRLLGRCGGIPEDLAMGGGPREHRLRCTQIREVRTCWRGHSFVGLIPANLQERQDQGSYGSHGRV